MVPQVLQVRLVVQPVVLPVVQLEVLLALAHPVQLNVLVVLQVHPVLLAVLLEVLVVKQALLVQLQVVQSLKKQSNQTRNRQQLTLNKLKDKQKHQPLALQLLLMQTSPQPALTLKPRMPRQLQSKMKQHHKLMLLAEIRPERQQEVMQPQQSSQ